MRIPRIQKETIKHKEAFEYYFALGRDRNLIKVSRKFKVSIVSVNKWSKSFHWQKRIAKRDKELGDALAVHTNRSLLEEKKWYLDLIRKQLEQYEENLKNEKVHLKEPSDFSRLVKLAQLLVGEPTEKTVVELSTEERTAILENLNAIRRGKE